MNDGPHKSLHMGRKWKKTAEYGDDENFDTSEVAARLAMAMLSELATLPFAKLNIPFQKDPQSLFEHEPAVQIEMLEACRQHCPGSSIGTTYLDGCICALAEGLTGTAVIRAGIAAAMEDCYASAERNMVEHYKRESTNRRADRLSTRLGEAKNLCNFEPEVQQILSTGQFKMRKRSAPRAAVNDGPPLLLGGQKLR